jgi:Protein of unknown function (DUF2769).
MEIEITEDTINLCHCPTCATYIECNLEGEAFCAKGAPKKKLKLSKEESQCDCLGCPVKLEWLQSSTGARVPVANFDGLQFCHGVIPSVANIPEQRVTIALKPLGTGARATKSGGV